MATAVTFTKTGNKASKNTTLPKEVFGEVPKNHILIHEAHRAYMAQGRASSAKTLTRGLVRGGGKKPWRQKGTGRARFGSIRNPIWTGGGIAFGPTGEQNYSIKMPKKAKQLALRQALSLKAAAGAVIVLEDFNSKDGKVKESLRVLNKLPAARSKLLVVDNKSDLTDRATRNIAGLEVTAATYLNVAKVMNADSIIITGPALDIIKKWLVGGSIVTKPDLEKEGKP